SNVLRLSDCPHEMASALAAAEGAAPAAERPLPAAPAPNGVTPTAEAPLEEGDETLEAMERRHIQRVLEACGGNKTEAARRLGVSLRSLYRRLDKMELR